MEVSFLIFAQLISIALCLIATRLTCRFISKHRSKPLMTFFLFGGIKAKHVAVAYLSIISLLLLYTVIKALLILY